MGKIKAIIPCCGFGTRMGMKSNESKEMLDDPVTGKKVIDYSLDLCRDHNLDPLIITRAAKTDLIDYIKNKPQNIDIMIHEPSGEWMDTVLASKDHWEQKNILLLPDTRFTPTDALFEIKSKLIRIHDLVFGVHEQLVKIPWGEIDYNAGNIWTSEKPVRKIFAWGIIGFDKDVGEDLFLHYKNTETWESFEGVVVFLDKFVDITRTGKIEKY